MGAPSSVTPVTSGAPSSFPRDGGPPNPTLVAPLVPAALKRSRSGKRAPRRWQHSYRVRAGVVGTRGAHPPARRPARAHPSKVMLLGSNSSPFVPMTGSGPQAHGTIGVRGASNSEPSGEKFVSYLNPLRLHFSGSFEAAVSTVNNDPVHYDSARFEPSYAQTWTGTAPDELNGWFNPDGSGNWRLHGCAVTAAFLADGAPAGPADP